MGGVKRVVKVTINRQKIPKLMARTVFFMGQKGEVPAVCLGLFAPEHPDWPEVAKSGFIAF
jgi:hypothetical protein